MNKVYTLREEEVEAASRAEQERPAGEPEEHPTVGQDEIDALVGRPGVLRSLVIDAARIHGVVAERAPLKLLALNALGTQPAPLPNTS